MYKYLKHPANISEKCVVTYQYCTVIKSIDLSIYHGLSKLLSLCVCYLKSIYMYSHFHAICVFKKKKKSVPCGWLLSTKMALEAWICLKAWICFSAKALFWDKNDMEDERVLYMSLVFDFFPFFFEVQERGNPFCEWTLYRPLFIVWLRLDRRMTSHDIHPLLRIHP